MQAGEAQAWSELYRVHRDELLFFVRTRMGPGLRATVQSEDVLQSVALEAFRELPHFEPRGEGSLRRFLHVLVLHKLRDLADRAGAQKRAGGVALTDELAARLAAPGEGALSYADPAYERLEQAVARLPDDMREVLVLRRIEGRSSREVAELLGKSDDAVRKLHSRALARLSIDLGGARGAERG
jgi:RNA polymerase sigma-70 factor (ECF subfamily)